MFCIVIIECLLFTCIVDFWKKNGTFNDPIGIQSLQNDHNHNQLQTSLVHKNHNTKGLTQPLSSSSSSSLLFESRMSSSSGIEDNNNNNSANNETTNNKLKNRYDNVMNSVDDDNNDDGCNRFSPSTTTITTTATTNHADINDNISINSIFDFDKVIELVNKSVDQSLTNNMINFSNDTVSESHNYELNHDDTIESVKDDSLLDESNIAIDDNSVYSGFFDIHNYHINNNDSSNNDVTNNSSLLLQDGKNDSFQYDVSVDDDFSNIIYDNIDNTMISNDDYINDVKSLSDDKHEGSSNDINLQDNDDSVVRKSDDDVDVNNGDNYEVDEEETVLSTYLSWLDKQHH